MELKEFVIYDGKTHPAFIICPGGGYNHLSNHEGDNVAQELNKRGISCFVLSYDFMFPKSLEDAKAAIRQVRGNCEKYNVDPKRIGIMGFSAGAHLAGLAAEHFDRFEDGASDISARPDVCCLCYPVVTLSKDWGHFGSRCTLGEKIENTELAEVLSLENSVRSDMPPVFIWHTFEDKSVPAENSLYMAKALKEKDVFCELHIFPEGRHGLDLAKTTKGACLWVSLFYDFLERLNFL